MIDKVFLALQTIIICITPSIAHSAEFEVRLWHGSPIVSLSGEIIEGDLQRLQEALSKVDKWEHGAKIVHLNSSGGMVGEALKISKYLDNEDVHMIVPNGATCASACASILFVGGKYRTIEPGGLLGQHSCSIAGEPSPECNEILAQHAIANGVSHGSIMAFVTYTPPSEILWFSREDADCYGVSFYPLEDQLSFQKSEPCVMRTITGREPEVQNAWRLDIERSGYRAFFRPVADNVRELELGIYCDELQPGSLFFAVEVGGPREVIRNAMKSGTVRAAGVSKKNRDIEVEQVDEIYSRIIMKIDKSEVISFLRNASSVSVRINATGNYEDIVVFGNIESSKKAIIFAANNCIN
jgi:ATP-dependent protease ClpP protease subunit